MGGVVNSHVVECWIITWWNGDSIQSATVLKCNYVLYLLPYTVQCFLCSYAKSVGAKHFHTSAKLDKGIEELFLDLSRSEYCQHSF